MDDLHQNNLSGLVVSNEKIHFKFFIIVLSLFVATWISSDIAAVKFVDVFGITLTGGFIVFPFTTMLGIVLVEVYGYKNARQAIWSGVIINLTFVFFMSLIYLIPSAPTWKHNNEFKIILLPGIRIVLSSIISFLIAEFVNSYLMSKMKIKSNNDYYFALIKRIFLSCMFSFLLDILIFLTLAFYGTMPNSALEKLIFYAYIKKVLCQIIFIPFICYLVHFLQNLEKVNIYDFNTDFSPFSFDNIYDINSLIPSTSNHVESTQKNKYETNPI